MFEIDELNKVTLTKGDLAIFDCTITNAIGEVRIPQDGDVLVLSIDDTDFSSTANIIDNKYVFTIDGTDLADVDEGVYYYRVVLNDDYTVIQECFFDLLGNGQEEEEPEPEPEPTPTPTPDDPEPYNGIQKGHYEVISSPKGVMTSGAGAVGYQILFSENSEAYTVDFTVNLPENSDYMEFTGVSREASGFAVGGTDDCGGEYTYIIDPDNGSITVHDIGGLLPTTSRYYVYYFKITFDLTNDAPTSEPPFNVPSIMLPPIIINSITDSEGNELQCDLNDTSIGITKI